MNNQLSDQLSSSVPPLKVQRDSKTDHSSPNVQRYFPEYIFERSVECGTKEDCIPHTNKFNIVSNLSTINIEDLYSQTNTVRVSNAPKPSNNTESSDSQFLQDYPIIRRRTKDPSSLEGGPSSSYHDTIAQTGATKDHCDKEGFVWEQQQCSRSVRARLQGRTFERTQGISVGTTGVCFSGGNQTPVNCFSGRDQKTANSVSSNGSCSRVDEFKDESLELSSSTSSASTVVQSNVKPEDSLSSRESKAGTVKEVKCWDADAPGFGETAEEFSSKNKKRKMDHPKSESQFRHFFNRARSEDGSGCSGSKRSSVFQKWGQVSNEISVGSILSEKSAPCHSGLSKSNLQKMDFNGPVEKDNRKKKFKKWLKDRTLCLSKPKNNDCDVSRKEFKADQKISLPEQTDITRASTRNNGDLATSAVSGTVEAYGRAVTEKRDDDDSNSNSPSQKSRSTRLRPRNYRHFLLTKEHRTRAYLKERSHVLGRWFVKHFAHPYPSKEQKDKLAELTKMTRNQVSEWFGNMRRRVREATRDLSLCWEERVRRYNSLITGKSEPLPILPHDTINTWAPEEGRHHHADGVGPSVDTGGRGGEERQAVTRHVDHLFGQETRMVENVQCPVDQEEHHLAQVDRRYLIQEKRHVFYSDTHIVSQGRPLINHEVNFSNLKATSNLKEGQIPAYKNHFSQRDIHSPVLGGLHPDSCSFTAALRTDDNSGDDNHFEGTQDDLTSSREDLEQDEGDDSSEDCRTAAQSRTPEHASVESATDHRSSSTKFKRDLIHRYQNDSSDSLPTPSSLPMETPAADDPVQPAKPDLQCSRRLFTEIRKRPDAPHTVPIARVDPWPSKESTRSSTKSLSQKIHPKQKSMSSIEDPLPLSYSSQPKTYSRAPRPKPYYIIKSTSEPQSMVAQNNSLHSSFPNLLGASAPTNAIYRQHLSPSSPNPIPAPGMDTLRIPLCTSSPKLDTPNSLVSQMFVQSNSLSPLVRSPAKQVFTWSFTARPALLGHIGLQEQSFAPATTSVHPSRLSCPSITTGVATVASAFGESASRSQMSEQAVNHSSDEITAAYSLMQLQKM